MLPSEYLEQGWCQGNYANTGGNPESGKAISWCLSGAAWKAFGYNDQRRLRFQDAIMELVGYSFTTWNDDPDRTQEEVVAVAKLAEIKLGLREVETASVYELEGASSIVIDQTAIGEYPVETLERQGLPVEGVKFSHQKKSDMYSILKVLFEQGRIKIPDNAKLREQLGFMMYEYQAAGTVKIYPPSGEHDDMCDALALLAYKLVRGGNVEVSVVGRSEPLKAVKAYLQVCVKCSEYFELPGSKTNFETEKGHVCPDCE